MVTAAQPSLSDLNGLISKVRSYPISANQLLGLARDINAPRQVVNFYRSFSPDRVFDDKEDLFASSEAVEVMRQERPQMPREEEIPEED